MDFCLPSPPRRVAGLGRAWAMGLWLVAFGVPPPLSLVGEWPGSVGLTSPLPPELRGCGVVELCAFSVASTFFDYPELLEGC